MALLSILWDIDPILLHLGPLEIRWYGLLWAIGIYICYLIQVKLYSRENWPAEWGDSIFMWLAAGVIIGARLGHCWFYEWHLDNDPIQIFGWTIKYHNPYIEHPMDLLKIWEGGLSSHGGAIGLIIASALLYRKHFRATCEKRIGSQMKSIYTGTLFVLDRLCIGVCITGCLIRLGNLFNSEIYGGPTDLPWGFIFVRDGQTVPCHPTQIYEMLYCLFAFAVTVPMFYKWNCQRRPGLIIGTFLLIIFGTRILVELIKNNQEAFEDGLALNMGQLLSIPFVVWGIVTIVMALRKAPYELKN